MMEEKKSLWGALDSQKEKYSLPFSSIPNTEDQFELSVIIPTRNEAANVRVLLERIERATHGTKTEVIFVDDSSDNTPDVIREVQEYYSMSIALIARPPGRRIGGLGGAVVEGLRVARASWVCVMDADLQHPPEMIPRILKQAQETGSEIVVGSRLTKGGDARSLGFHRFLISHLFAFVTRVAFPMRLRRVTDPLSGFFLVRRETIDPDRLQPNGFKILLEIVVRFPSLKVSEIPIQFGYRHAGQSKASVSETIRFFRLLLGLRLMVDQNLIRFLLVGGSGLVVNSMVLALVKEAAGVHYLWSAAVATQASTLWNFLLTEMWVFGRRETQNSFILRMLGFLLMNNLLLLLRAPILTILTSFLGIHYLVSNLISLFSMTLIRFLISDQWIWSKAGQSRLDRIQTTFRRWIEMFKPKTYLPKSVSLEVKPHQVEFFTHFYNLHDIIQVASMYKLPELEYFRVSELNGEPDIRLRLERRRRERRHKDPASVKGPFKNRRRIEAPRRTGNDIHYAESPGRYGFEVSIAYKETVEVSVSRILGFSLHVLYTNVIEPILRWAFVRKGYALVHAACVAVDGWAMLLTAQTDTGKTSTILRAVNNYSCGFLSDDMTIVSRDGIVRSYPKPLTISNHTVNALNSGTSLTVREKIALQFQSRLHSRSGRRIGLRLSETSLPAATMNTIVQMLVPPPKYMVHRLIPKVSYVDQAALAVAVIIERGPKHEEMLGHRQAVAEFVQNAEDAYGFPPYPVLADSLSSWDGYDLHHQEQKIIADALEQVHTIRLSDPQYDWWRQLPILAMNTPLASMGAADD